MHSRSFVHPSVSGRELEGPWMLFYTDACRLRSFVKIVIHTFGPSLVFKAHFWFSLCCEKKNCQCFFLLFFNFSVLLAQQQLLMESFLHFFSQRIRGLKPKVTNLHVLTQTPSGYTVYDTCAFLGFSFIWSKPLISALKLKEKGCLLDESDSAMNPAL